VAKASCSERLSLILWSSCSSDFASKRMKLFGNIS